MTELKNNKTNKSEDSIFDYEHPFVCTDAVVFTIKTERIDSYRKLPETNLRILLYKRNTEPFNNKWCLPGGFLNIDETPEENIKRKLLEKSKVEHCWLEQLYTFCNVDRDPRSRVISITYLGLINELDSQNLSEEKNWFTVNYQENGEVIFLNNGIELKENDFGFDHYKIIKTAIERLKSKVVYERIAFNLVPEEFTLTQLQDVYEVVLNKKDQPANFRRKIAEYVEETGNQTSEKGHRPAKLFKKK